MTRRSRWTDEQRAAAVARVAAGETQLAVARDLGTSSSLISEWCARAGVIPPLKQRTVALRRQAMAERLSALRAEQQREAREHAAQAARRAAARTAVERSAVERAETARDASGSGR